MSKIRIGIIGCGGMMSVHLNNMVKMSDAEIVALADNDAGRIQGVQAGYADLADVPGFDSHRKMLKAVELDAVIISTPHTLHYQQVIDCLDAGAHVLCEKPLCCSAARANKIIAKGKQKKKVVMVSYQRHYQGAYQFIRKLIQEGSLGTVQHVQALLCQNWKNVTMGTWRQVPELSGGGMLNDSGSHLLDLILWTTGLKATEVAAFIDNCGTPVEINSAVNLKFNNGATGSLSVVGDGLFWWEEVSFTLTKGAIFYNNGDLFYHTGHGGERHDVSKFADHGSPDRNFLDVIQGKAENRVPPVCGLRVTELTEAVYKSAASGGKVIKVK